MLDLMNHRERVLACLSGEDVDRPPASMWRHFYEAENSADTLAMEMIGFQRQFDWDFMKVNPRASYHAEDWGLKMRHKGGDAPEPVHWPIQEPNDWTRIEILRPEEGVMGEQLEALGIIAKDLNGQIPFMMTVFTPLSIASRMIISEDLFVQHLREYPDKVIQALEVITETFIGFSRACIEHDASGLFFATTSLATTDILTTQEYAELGRPYDLRILDSVSDAELNILHVCKDNNMLSDLKDYPVHAFNWDTFGRGNLSLEEGRDILGGKVVIGGVPHKDGLIGATSPEIECGIRDTRISMGNRSWMLGTGCTFPADTSMDKVRVVADITKKTF